MSKRDTNLLIEDIISSGTRILQYTANLSFEDFLKDNKTLDAVIRNFEIIGEAANRLPFYITLVPHLGGALIVDAVEFAEGKIMDYYHSLGGVVVVPAITLYYKQKINEYMQGHGGTATLQPGSNITVTEKGQAYYSWPIIGCL